MIVNKTADVDSAADADDAAADTAAADAAAADTVILHFCWVGAFKQPCQLV